MCNKRKNKLWNKDPYFINYDSSLLPTRKKTLMKLLVMRVYDQTHFYNIKYY